MVSFIAEWGGRNVTEKIICKKKNSQYLATPKKGKYMRHNHRFALNVAIGIVATFLSLAQPKTLVLLHTNDIHASYLPHEALWVRENPKPLIGGFRELEYVLDSLRSVEPLTLLLDGGDVMTGNPITEYRYGDAEGGALFEMMNRLGYEAWTLGNHDFDISVENLKKLTSIARFPTVAANVRDSAGALPVHNKEYVIVEKNGLRIGIFGLMSKEFYGLVNKKSSRGIKILPPIETAHRLVALLVPQTDLLIALTHQGVEEDTLLAKEVPQIDVIVGAHSHTRLKKPLRVGKTLVVQAGSNCEYLGVLKLTVEKHTLLSYEGTLLPLWVRENRPATTLTRFIDSVQQNIEKDYGSVLGVLRTPWLRARGGESGIGNFITDAQREAAGVDVAFMNDHGIRADVPEGPITKRKLFEVLPFRNILCTFTLSGAELRRIVEYYIQEHPAIQTSGLLVQWKQNADRKIDFVKFLVNGKPLDEKATYTAAASDYLLGEARRYLGIDTPYYTLLDKTVFTAVEEKIRKEKEVDSRIEGRITNVSR